MIKGVFTRLYCCYGNLLCHENDNNVFSNDRAFFNTMIAASGDKEFYIYIFIYISMYLFIFIYIFYCHTYICTLQNITINTTYITILKLHTTYILAVLLTYNSLPYFYCLPYRKQTNGTKQIPKLIRTINWGYNSYFRLLFTSSDKEWL